MLSNFLIKIIFRLCLLFILSGLPLITCWTVSAGFPHRPPFRTRVQCHVQLSRGSVMRDILSDSAESERVLQWITKIPIAVSLIASDWPMDCGRCEGKWSFVQILIGQTCTKYKNQNSIRVAAGRKRVRVCARIRGAIASHGNVFRGKVDTASSLFAALCSD